MSLTKKLKHFGSAGLIGLAGVVGGGCETFEDTAALGALYGAAAMNEPNPARANAMAAAGQYLGQMADYQARQEIAERGRSSVQQNVYVNGGGERSEKIYNRQSGPHFIEGFPSQNQMTFFAATGFDPNRCDGGPNIVKKNIFYEGETFEVVADLPSGDYIVKNYLRCIDINEKGGPIITIKRPEEDKGFGILTGGRFSTLHPDFKLGDHWEVVWLIEKNGVEKEVARTQFSIIRNRPNPDGQK